ncbi:MAG: class II fumarate hydratase, partial [Bdellovibrionales bacterium]|nr:class II fumarate hydratase [Bdellovibrionales bacterium]
MRIEKDSMGEMEVPDNALYGASTQRAVLNFPVSDLRFPRAFIAALGAIKRGAALANEELGLLDAEKTKAIVQAADEVRDGKLDDQFVVDIFQTGSGTSTNMNTNEVIANRAIQILGGNLGDKSVVHPNDHVNMSQSSNDVIPTAIHVSTVVEIERKLLPALKKLRTALEEKAKQFSSIIKSGRTHLQDATPVTLGQEFSGFAAQIGAGELRIRQSLDGLRELALGGTAVGTGLNTHPEFAKKAITHIGQALSVELREAPNHFEAQGARDAVVFYSGALRTVACSLMKIANDIRWLASGPRLGLGEIFLPEIQPGSSIMPAKVNPVVCESVMMVAAQVMGNDTAIVVGGQHGNLELNVMLPVLGYNVLQSTEILASVSVNFVEKCISGIRANEERCNVNAEKSLAVCTSLAPIIGYDKAAELAKRAYKEDKSVREMALEMAVLPEDELEKALDLMS